jgi:hypothetical protein
MLHMSKLLNASFLSHICFLWVRLLLRASILSAALITLVQKLTTGSLVPWFRSWISIISVLFVCAGAYNNKDASLNC